MFKISNPAFTETCILSEESIPFICRPLYSKVNDLRSQLVSMSMTSLVFTSKNAKRTLGQGLGPLLTASNLPLHSSVQHVKPAHIYKAIKMMVIHWCKICRTLQGNQLTTIQVLQRFQSVLQSTFIFLTTDYKT